MKALRQIAWPNDREGLGAAASRKHDQISEKSILQIFSRQIFVELAGEEGLEPTTPGFGDRYSNQIELHSYVRQVLSGSRASAQVPKPVSTKIIMPPAGRILRLGADHVSSFIIFYEGRHIIHHDFSRF